MMPNRMTQVSISFSHWIDISLIFLSLIHNKMFHLQSFYNYESIGFDNCKSYGKNQLLISYNVLVEMYAYQRHVFQKYNTQKVYMYNKGINIEGLKLITRKLTTLHIFHQLSRRFVFNWTKQHLNQSGP